MKEIDNQLEADITNLFLDEIPMPIFYKNTELVYLYCNRAYLEYLGVSREEVINHKAIDFSQEQLASAYETTDHLILKTKIAQEYQTKLINRDGKVHDFKIHKSAVCDHDGNIQGIIGIMYDITQQVLQSKRTEQIEKIKDFLLEVSNAVMEKASLDEIFRFVLEKSISAIDHADFGCILVVEDNVLHIATSVGYHEEDVKKFHLPLEQSYQWLSTKGKIKDTLIINNIQEYLGYNEGPKFLDNKKGDQVLSCISAPIFLNNKLFGFFNIDSVENNIFTQDDYEIVEYLRKQLIIALTNFKLYENVIYFSEHDSLTSLYNRRFFEDALNKNIKRATRYDQRFYVVSMDLNGLKNVNDTMGHLAGDELIRYFSKTLKENLRSTDVVSRTGGDEFTLIMFYASIEDIEHKMEKLKLKFIDNPLVLFNHKIICSFSYGISTFPNDGSTVDKLMGIADNRMYKHKKNL